MNENNNENNNGGLRIYGYCRESTKEQAINGYNIDDQERKIRKYVDLYYSENDELKIYRDEGASAKSVNRPKMREIIKLIKKGQVDVLIVHNLDRLTRRVKDLGALLELFQKYNVQLISITEKIDTTTSMGRFFIYLIVLIAQWEQDTISEKTKRGLEEGALQGNYTRGGRAPIGYTHNKSTKRLEIDEKTAPIIRDLFEKIASGQYSQQAMAHRFNEQNVGEKKNWVQSDISRILLNRIYYGCFVTISGKMIDDHQPALISKELWMECFDVIKGGDSLQRHSYIFKNYVYCKGCGCRCVQSTTMKGKVYKYYVCKECGGRINEDRVMLLTKDRITDIGIEINLKDKLAEYRKLYRKHVQNMDSLTTAYKSEVIGVDYFKQAIDFEESAVREIANAIARLKQDATYSFSSVPYSEKRQILRTYLEKIIVDFPSQLVFSLQLKENVIENLSDSVIGVDESYIQTESCDVDDNAHADAEG